MPGSFPGQALPRGKVMFGAVRDHARTFMRTNNLRVSVQGGQMQFMPITSFLPGQAVVLNSFTGMIGIPEQTQDGIKIKSLLNPNFRMNGQVQINNKDIQKAVLDPSLQGQVQFDFIPKINADGFYRIIVAKHKGDTRGNDWYSDLITVGVGQGVPPSLAVKGYG
jgi:hypothetical protein